LLYEYQVRGIETIMRFSACLPTFSFLLFPFYFFLFTFSFFLFTFSFLLFPFYFFRAPLITALIYPQRIDVDVVRVSLENTFIMMLGKLEALA
jgi:hypothetical protein